MFCRYLKNVPSRRDNSKTILRCLENALCRLGLQTRFTCSNSTLETPVQCMKMFKGNKKDS